MFSSFFSEIFNPDISSICGREVSTKEIKLRIFFTLKGEEENESALDPMISIAYFGFFFRFMRRKFDKITMRRVKIRKKAFQESMMISFELKGEEEIFYLLSFFRGFKEREKGYEISSLRSLKPYPFADLEKSIEIDQMKQFPIQVEFPVKKNRSLMIFRQILCQPI
jgi:hypothetical protein